MLKARLNSLFVLILPVGIAVGIVPAQTLGVNTNNATLATLYSFTSTSGGPAGALVQATNGDFYGTTNTRNLLWNGLQNDAHW